MTNPRHDKKLMSAADAAVALGISRQRIHQLVKERRLTGLRDRTFLYVPVAEVEAMREQRARGRGVPPGMLTKDEVADRFGVAPRTVQDWYSNGSLPGVMAPSRMLAFKAEDVEAFSPPRRGRPPMR